MKLQSKFGYHFRRSIFTLAFAFYTIALFSQSISEVKSNPTLYIWGEGRGMTLGAADKDALASIINQISVSVENNYCRLIEEKDGNFKEIVKDVVKTYSASTLNNTMRIVLADEPDAVVFRFIKRAEVNKVFEARKGKILEMTQYGQSALENLRISDALRNFYWAHTLLRSHPNASDIKFTNSDGKEVLLITWLPKQINYIFDNLKYDFEKFDPRENYSIYTLNFKFKDMPTTNLDYNYWSGQNWSNLYSAKDGLGLIELPGSQIAETIKIKIEYIFENEANIDMELRDVISKLPPVPYKKSYFSISTDAIIKANTSETKTGNIAKTQFINTTQVNSLGSIALLTDTEKYKKTIYLVTCAIDKKEYESIMPLFSDEGFIVFEKLIKYGNAKIIKTPDLKFVQFGHLVICRAVPMKFTFKNSLKSFTESVVFYFDSDNKICNISFGLEDVAVNNIANCEGWSEQERVSIISFLENYKTAFALKQYDYINSIFSSDALIITGVVIKTYNSDNKYLNDPIVRYNKQTKEEYMRKLKYSFDSKEYINIRFADNTIKKSGKYNNVYGIQIKQEYYSSNYGDTGYLFLMIDFNDSLNPIIHVRTWQPKKNEDGSIYGLSDF